MPIRKTAAQTAASGALGSRHEGVRSVDCRSSVDGRGGAATQAASLQTDAAKRKNAQTANVAAHPAVRRAVSRRGFLAGAASLAGATFLVGASATGLAGCSSSGSKSELKSIVVGCDSYPPANYLDENGDPAGFDVDIATEAFSRMGYAPTFKYIDWEDKNELVADGTIDCIAGCFTMTGRESEYNWAGPYLRSRQVVAVDPASSIYTLADLEDKVVAVQSTTKPEGIFLNRTKEGLPQVRKVYSFADRSLLYPALSKGYVDAVAAHEMSINQYEEDYGIDYRILDESLLEVGLGVAFYKDDKRDIAEKLDAVFEEMLADGSMEGIVKNYFDNAAYLTEVDGLVSE